MAATEPDRRAACCRGSAEEQTSWYFSVWVPAAKAREPFRKALAGQGRGALSEVRFLRAGSKKKLLSCMRSNRIVTEYGMEPEMVLSF